ALRALLLRVVPIRGLRLLRSLTLLLRILGSLLALRLRVLLLLLRILLLRGIAVLVPLLRVLLLPVLLRLLILLLLLLLLEQLRDEIAVEAGVGVVGHGRERLVVGGERLFEVTRVRERVAEVVAGLRALLILERLGGARVVFRAVERGRAPGRIFEELRG